MSKLITTPIAGQFASTTELNNNFDLIEVAVENTLSRDGTTPNSMGADLDMDANDLLNVQNTNTEKLFVNGQEVLATSDLTVSQSEVQTLTDGQTSVVFTNDVQNASFYVGGLLADDARLRSTTDFTIDIPTKTVTLTQSYPADTTITMLYYDGVNESFTTNTILYDTVNQMLSASIPAGYLVTTRGYHAAGDGGLASYYVKTSSDFGGTPDEYGDHTLANGTVAVLQSAVMNIRKYGAKGDGATNDYTAIQAAIDAAESVNGQVFIPVGTYNFEAGLTITEAVTVVGEDERGSILYKVGNFIGLTTTKGCTLRDFTLDSDGGVDASQGLHITSATYRSRVSRLTISAQGSHGIEIFSSNLGTYEDLTILNNSGDGILLNGNATPDVNAAVFKNVDIRGNNGIGFNIDNAWNTFGYGITCQSNTG